MALLGVFGGTTRQHHLKKGVFDCHQSACEGRGEYGDLAGLEGPGASEESIEPGEEGRGEVEAGEPILPDTGDDPDEVDLPDEDRIREDLDQHSLYRLDDLNRYRLETRAGEEVGEVEALLIHPVSGQIRYLILDADEDLDLDEEYVLVPWAALEEEVDGRVDRDRDEDGDRDGPGRGDNGRDIPPGHLPPPGEREPMDCRDLPPGHLPPPDLRDELCLDFDEDLDEDPDDDRAYRTLHFPYGREILVDGPVFSGEDLDDLEEGRWEEEADDFWRRHVEDLPEREEDGEGRGYIRIDEDDFTLLDREGREIGQVADLLVHLPSGEVRYAVLEAGEDGYIVAPFSSLAWVEEEEAFALRFDPDELDRLPHYEDEDEIPGLRWE